MTEPDPERGRLLVRNEFASVALERDPGAGEALVRVLDLRTGRAVSLDPLELEALTRLTRDDLTALVDPSFAGLGGARRTPAGIELVPGEGEEDPEVGGGPRPAEG
ncbi:MAG TPA: hypothetical protein VFD01_08900 [Candidatus Dormibacteraeota bacterium]|jgi:hypothetical protein|nr:hypothetical protein [Candidatus Dormibacteraeota bacterium]